MPRKARSDGRYVHLAYSYMGAYSWGEVAGLEQRPVLRAIIIAIVVLGIGMFEVCAVCVWRLLTMVRAATVFTRDAFRWVDTIIAAIAVTSVLTLALAAATAPYRDRDMAPWGIFLFCGLALVVAGVALLMFVMRMLLAKATARDLEAAQLQDERSVVI
jgi:hypothetical protein